MSALRILPAIALIALTSIPAHGESLNPATWRGDARFLAAAVDTIHPMPYLHHSRAEWSAAAEDLERRLPSLTYGQAIAGFARIVALLGDGHSRLDQVRLPGHGAPQLGALPGPGFDARYPIACGVFRDGVFITRATPEHARFLGYRVTAIDGIPIAAVADSLRPFVSADNELWVRYMIPELLRSPVYLDAAHVVTDPAAPLRLRLESPTRARRDIRIAAVHEDSTTIWIGATERLAAKTPAPLTERMTDNYAFEDLGGTPRTVYVRIRQFVEPKGGESLARFAERLFAWVDSTRTQRMVVDVRGNGGGDNYLVQPLIHGMIASRAVNRPGHLFVLTDRGTFSAAVNFTAQAERNTHAIFVGEPTGSGPNACGDSRRVKLPASGITVRISALYWQESDPRDKRPWIVPDLQVSPTFADWIGHRDPVLEAALAVRAPETTTLTPPNQNWVRDSQKAKVQLPGW